MTHGTGEIGASPLAASFLNEWVGHGVAEFFSTKAPPSPLTRAEATPLKEPPPLSSQTAEASQ